LVAHHIRYATAMYWDAYVTDFLSAVDTPSVALDLKDENSQCIGRPSKNDDDLPYEYLYVVMPMRLT